MAKDFLTSDQMKQAINEGGSVLHNGRLLTRHEHIKRAFETPEDIDAQIKELERRKAARAGGKQTPVDDLKATASKPGDLPEDFPGRAELEAGSVTLTKAAIRNMSDEQLLAIKGIGAAKLTAIREALR